MSDKMRWRYGETNPVVADVISATVIEIGDLVYQDTDDAKPASSQADTGTEEGNQEAFEAKFLGVAMQRSKSGETNPIRVATTGVFEFDCPSATHELGDLVGVDEASSGTALLDQQVATVGDVSAAVGRVAKRYGSATTTVLVDIRSKVMTGGVAGSTPSGA
jgi:hypothetical protein